MKSMVVTNHSAESILAAPSTAERKVFTVSYVRVTAL